MSGKRVDVKRCSMCGMELPAELFHHNNHYCKPCRKVYNAMNWARWRDKQPRRVCDACGMEKVEPDFAGPEVRTCRRCLYLARLRQPGWELRKARREGKRPEKNVSGVRCQVSGGRKQADKVSGDGELGPGPWAVGTRTGGRVPVLRYEQHGGVWMCFMTDGVEETALFVGAQEAVGAWNAGRVSRVSGCKQPGQVSRAAEMDRARLEERARSGELSPVTIVSTGVQAECSTLGASVKES